MDTSATYIQMCGKAEEIQKSRLKYINYSIKGGQEFIYYTGRNGDPQDSVLFVRAPFQPDGFHYIIEETWLPRQDQLQKIIGDYRQQECLMSSYGYDGEEYNEFLNLNYTTYWSEFTSMEQLWLGFVMAKKYNKVWDGQTWIARAVTARKLLEQVTKNSQGAVGQIAAARVLLQDKQSKEE